MPALSRTVDSPPTCTANLHSQYFFKNIEKATLNPSLSTTTYRVGLEGTYFPIPRQLPSKWLLDLYNNHKRPSADTHATACTCLNLEQKPSYNRDTLNPEVVGQNAILHKLANGTHPGRKSSAGQHPGAPITDPTSRRRPRRWQRQSHHEPRAARRNAGAAAASAEARRGDCRSGAAVITIHGHAVCLRNASPDEHHRKKTDARVDEECGSIADRV
mmetsp:Transcript_25883/g.86134  ORF Transcript_25883/g.86134 Transcript_25883/m.86134 type:complete len:216 (-) Transcript_25883:1540-2187(-)